MENQSHTQEKSSEFTTSHLESKKKILRGVKENLNYIFIVLIMIVNILISTIRIENGYVKFCFPQDVLSWVIWGVLIAIQTLIAVLILEAFRRQGVKFGLESIKDLKEKYFNLVVKTKEFKQPRDLKTYLTKKTTRDSLTKAPIYAVVSFIMGGGVLLGFSLNNVISLIINLIFATAFGIKAMIDAEDYVVNELSLWYRLEIEKLEKEFGKKETKKCQDSTIQG